MIISISKLDMKISINYIKTFFKSAIKYNYYIKL